MKNVKFQIPKNLYIDSGAPAMYHGSKLPLFHVIVGIVIKLTVFCRGYSSNSKGSPDFFS